MLQTMLSMSSGATKDTVAACQAVMETLEISLPPSQNKVPLREEIAVKLAGAAEVVRSVSSNCGGYECCFCFRSRRVSHSL